MEKNVILISYDLCKPERNYQSLIDKIRNTFPKHTHVLESVWIVETDYECDQVRDILSNYTDKDDKLITATLESISWKNLSPSSVHWLKNASRSNCNSLSMSICRLS